MTKLAESFGDSVRIEYRPGGSGAAARRVAGGRVRVRPAGRRAVCSVGFNTLDASNRNVVLTAGHCVNRAGRSAGAATRSAPPGRRTSRRTTSGRSGTRTRATGSRRRRSTSTTAPTSASPASGTTRPWGPRSARAGARPDYTCGTITAVNQTVTYTDGNILYGLVRHNACVEGGDSGGSNISAAVTRSA